MLDKSFLPGYTAIMVPHTSDGRVMFAIPWQDHTLIGTTDTSINSIPFEPVPMENEIEFLLVTAGRYLAKRPTKSDILSAFAGVRPLVKSGGVRNTAALSRDHTIHIDPSGLISITEAKWTTYRTMAEDCVNQAAALALLPVRPSATRTLRIHGYDQHTGRFGRLAIYGAEALHIQDLISADASLGEPRWDPRLRGSSDRPVSTWRPFESR